MLIRSSWTVVVTSISWSSFYGGYHSRCRRRTIGDVGSKKRGNANTDVHRSIDESIRYINQSRLQEKHNNDGVSSLMGGKQAPTRVEQSRSYYRVTHSDKSKQEVSFGFTTTFVSVSRSSLVCRLTWIWNWSLILCLFVCSFAGFGSLLQWNRGWVGFFQSFVSTTTVVESLVGLFLYLTKPSLQ
jgi:hypothetical protein